MNTKYTSLYNDCINTISLFSGIGAYEKAATNLGLNMNILNYCEIDKYAATAYSVIHGVPEEKNLGDISSIDFTKLPKCDLVTYSFPCFTAGTLILTDKGYKNIEDIVVGDKVLTHTNSFKKVLMPMEKVSDHIYKLYTPCSLTLNVTEEHPFYVRRKSKEGVLSKPQWINTKDLTMNDYIGVAINQKAIIHSELVEEGIHEYLDNEFFWYFVGCYLSKGFIVNEKLSLVLVPDSKEKILNVLDRFNLEYKIYLNENVNKVEIYDNKFNNFLRQFGTDIFDKTINEIILDLPPYLLEFFIEGCLDYEHLIAVQSKELSIALGQCIAKALKRPFNIIDFDFGNKPYYLVEYEDINKDKVFFENGYVWCKVEELKKENTECIVYNMEVEGDNSYTANNLIVHNCQSISTAGRKEGIIKGKTKSGLVYDALDVIEHTSPKVAIMENVKNLVGKEFIEDFNNLLQILDDMGYNSYWQVMNSVDYGMPHRRSRVILVSIRKDVDQGYVFPESIPLEKTVMDYIDKDDTNVQWVNEKDTPKVYSALIRKGYEEVEGVSKCPSTREYSGFKPITDCLLAHDALTKNLVQFKNDQGEYVIRRMTPLESFRLMGFNDEDYFKAKKKLEEKYYNGKARSDTQTYRMAGNSVVVDVLEAVMRNLYIKE